MLLLLLSACFLGFITLFILFLKYVDADLTLYYYDYLDDVSDRLRNKVIWITGASSGLGEYLAYELAKHGNKLILSGTNKERLESVKAKCSEIGLPEDDILVLPFNMTDYDVHEECIKKVLQKFGKLDILVNNAGRSQRANFEDIDISVDKELFDINVFATLNLTRKVLPHFLENKSGHFVVTSSCVGKMGAASSASYTASKHALHGYFETLRTEMSDKNIDVTILCPGPVFSRFLENAFTGAPRQKFGKPTLSTDRRMPTERCGRLMAVAMAHKVDEAWICIQPCLIFFYLAQYTPTFFRKIIIGKLYTAERAEKFREGRW
ncbi:Dehydrogenase/reductase SDR family member 7, partial [Stegodyphus mimosarum]